MELLCYAVLYGCICHVLSCSLAELHTHWIYKHRLFLSAKDAFYFVNFHHICNHNNFKSRFICINAILFVTTNLNVVRLVPQSALPPEQIIWCGPDSVLLYWEETLLMVGPNGGSIKYEYEESLFLVPECDGVRIISNSHSEFLQRVPDSTVSVFKIGSTSPAAMLYDALDHFDKRSAKVRMKISSSCISINIYTLKNLCFFHVDCHYYEFVKLWPTKIWFETLSVCS